MSKTMRAAVVRKFGHPLVIEERPIPTPGRGQVLVKIVASGVCHTDLHAADGDWPVKPALPFIPGHEGVGFVAAIGADVDNLKAGDRVGIPWLHTACGACEACIGGWETLCTAQQNTGYSVDGGYAEYALADARFVGLSSFDKDKYKIPSNVAIKMDDGDNNRAKQMLAYPWFKQAKWQREIQEMVKSGQKYELEALSRRGISFITEEYLPKKLKDKDWLE